jgi:hypothetical protein
MQPSMGKMGEFRLVMAKSRKPLLRRTPRRGERERRLLAIAMRRIGIGIADRILFGRSWEWHQFRSTPCVTPSSGRSLVGERAVVDFVQEQYQNMMSAR